MQTALYESIGLERLTWEEATDYTDVMYVDGIRYAPYNDPDRHGGVVRPMFSVHDASEPSGKSIVHLSRGPVCEPCWLSRGMVFFHWDTTPQPEYVTSNRPPGEDCWPSLEGMYPDEKVE